MGKHIVKLSTEEQAGLVLMVSQGKAAARKLTHARILLATDNNSGEYKTDEEISKMLYVSQKTVQRVRKECVENGLEATLERKSHSRHKPRKLQGEKEAHLIALCCSNPPEGRCRWTLELLANELVRLAIVDSIAPQTVLNTLKKMN